MSIISRMAPSNTGVPTIGNARTLFIAYLTALKLKGSTILRIESTDAVRSTDASTVAIMDTLKFLEVEYKGEVIDQATNQALGIYSQVGEELVRAGFAYFCSCSTDDLKRMKLRQITGNSNKRGYEGTCRDQNNSSGVLRFNAKNIANFFGDAKVIFNDTTYGSRSTDYRDIQDAVLLRADGTATYMLSNVVDDCIAEVTHIARGVDLLPQTAMQILLAKAVRHVLRKDAVTVEYTHLPLVVSQDGQKLSKRDKSAKSIIQYKADGYLPNAICQYICALGNTSIPTDVALCRDALVDLYDSSKTSKNNIKLCESNLKAMNKLHMAASSSIDLRILLENLGITTSKYSDKLIDLYKVRASTLLEMVSEMDFILEKLAASKSKVDNNKFKLDLVKGLQEFRQVVLEGRPSAPIHELLEAV